MKKSYNILSAFIVSLMGVGLMSVNNTNIKSDNHLIVRDVLRANASDNSGAIVNEVNEAPAQGNKVSQVYAQTATPVEEKTSIRFVAGIDTYTYEYAAFTITLKNENQETVKTVTYPVRSAYHSVKAGDSIKTATEVFGAGYNYLIAYTITDVPRDYWNYYYDVTASIGSDAEHVTKSETSNLKNIVKISDVILDGKMDDPIWTDEVKAKKYEFHNTDNTKHLTEIDLYASRNVNGIYFFANYKSLVSGALTPDVDPGWWEGENMEFKFYNNKGILKNAKQVALGENINQFWISYYNGSHASNLSGHYVAKPVLNNETNYYETVFEFFMSYDLLGITANEPIAFCVGANPDGQYWWNDSVWDKGFAACYKVTDDGIKQYLDEDECIDHNYAVEHTNPVTCKNDGLDTYTCNYCRHSYTKVVAATGAHNYVNEISRTASNCHTNGVVVYQCAGCDLTKEVTLPLDYFAHTGSVSNNVWSCCNKQGSDRYTGGGWANIAADWVYLLKDLAGDFKVTTTYTLETNVNQDTNGYWEGVLAIVQHQLSEKNGSPWVTRFDWWGWCDQWDSTEKLTNDFNNVDGDRDMVETNDNRDIWWTNKNGNNVQHNDFINAMSKSTVEWTCTRVGTTVTNNFVIYSQTGDVFTYYSQAEDISVNKNLSLVLTAEYAKFTVISVEKA